MLRNALIVVRDALLTVPVVIIAAPLWLLPWRIAVGLGRLYGSFGFAFWGRARRASMINLVRAWPELSFDEARSRTRKVFSNMGAAIAEGIQFSRGESRCPATPVYVAENPELERRIASDPRPKIFVTAHLGSWEVALMIARRVCGGRGAVIARGVDNRFVDALVRWIRFEHPAQWIEKRGAVPEAVRRLRDGESLAMLIDENGGPRGPHAAFFGRPASTRKTPAVLSMMTGAPIVVGAAVRREGQPFLFRLAVLESSQFAAESATATMPAEINRILEAWIRDTPDQWRWIHWRWKTRPDGTSETYTRADLREAYADSSSSEFLGEFLGVPRSDGTSRATCFDPDSSEELRGAPRTTRPFTPRNPEAPRGTGHEDSDELRAAPRTTGHPTPRNPEEPEEPRGTGPEELRGTRGTLSPEELRA